MSSFSRPVPSRFCPIASEPTIMTYLLCKEQTNFQHQNPLFSRNQTHYKLLPSPSHCPLHRQGAGQRHHCPVTGAWAKGTGKRTPGCQCIQEPVQALRSIQHSHSSVCVIMKVKLIALDYRSILTQLTSL